MPTDPPADESARKSSTPKPRVTAKPRAGIQRKTKAEREEYARKEAERAKERDTSDVGVAPKTSTRGRGGARGGRGGAAAIHKTERNSSNVVSGVFGAGSGNRIERGRGAVDVGYSEALDGGNTTAPVTNTIVEIDGSGTGRSGGGGGGSSGAGGRGRVNRAQDGIVDIGIERDEDADDQPRRDIERIWISSEEEEDEIVQRKGKQRRVSRTPRLGGGLRPVRAAITHPYVDTLDDTVTQKENPREDEIEDVEPEEIRTNAMPSTSKKDPPSSPELSKKTLKKVDIRIKDPRMSTETIEERAERLRLHQDVENMKLAFLQTSDTDDTVDSKEEEAVFGRTDHDRMFLFQLPPLVPQLRQSTFHKDQKDYMDVDEVQVKVEDTAAAAALASSGIPVESSQKQAEQEAPQKDPSKPIYTADADPSQRFAEGFVGKLRVHKSGKVSLDWGGTDMEVRYGTEVDFLQDVICVEDDPSVKTEGEGEEGALKGTGKAYAMGQVSKKMVLIPDWGRLYA